MRRGWGSGASSLSSRWAPASVMAEFCRSRPRHGAAAPRRARGRPPYDAPMGHEAAPLGSRERKRRRTNGDLTRAGLELFLTRGFEKTTVGDIVRRADVSERTFFRYFSSKEELILRPLRAACRALLAEVARRPEAEAPLRALHEGGLVALRRVTGERPERYLATLRVVCAEPGAMAACLRLSTEQQHELARVLAAREGLPDDDPRPLVLAGAFMATVVRAVLSWDERGDGTLESLVEAARSHVALLGPALAGSWR
ncbi:TetR family transcriptional regulator [Streptomyces sp. PT12]|nr:TetR family transcriptional regulator [Streptomyces sp. PT12]